MNQKLEDKLKSNNHLPEEELVQRAQSGDQQAFSDLYERFFPVVHKRVAYLIPTEDVDDVTQEIFIAMIRSLKTFRGDSKFSTWLRVITNRQIANYYRSNSQSLQDTELDDSWQPTQASSPFAARVRQDRKILVQQGLRHLPDHYKEIILLRFAEGLRFKDIAALQGKSLDATKSTFRRAIEAMRKELGEEDA